MSDAGRFAPLANGSALAWRDVPEWPVSAFTPAVGAELDRGGRLCSLFGVPEAGGVSLAAVIAFDAGNTLAVGRSAPCSGSFPALTPARAEAHLFEREVWEQHGVVPVGHPWLKPVRLDRGPGPAVGEFFRVGGGEIHEVAVGPVHAGVIEPGHFRFQCAGEDVLHLEIALGYQHRGAEEALPGGPHRATMSQMETVAGDTTIAHATAYATVLETLAGAEAPLRAQWLRALALELERLANHTGDLGALAGDVAFLPAASACGKQRGDFLNLTALVCGNRFGRGLVRPGGCRMDLEPERCAAFRRLLEPALEEVERAAAWLWDSATVRARFEQTGRLHARQAADLGLVGPAARACGLVRDVRFDHPIGWHRFAQIPVAVWPDGDVFARARALAGDPALGGVPARAARRGARRRPSRGPGRPRPRAPRGRAGRGLARRGMPRRADRRARPVPALQDHRPLVPQLDRARPGAARAGHLGLPALQQELQPLLLRLRPLRRKEPCSSSMPSPSA